MLTTKFLGIIIAMKSKKPCVKCRVNGELAYGRKVLPAVRLLHPASTAFKLSFFMPLSTGKGGFFMQNTVTKLWSDKKRILGMPISFTKYSLSEDRLFIDKGFLNLKSEEILLYRIRDLSVSRTLLQRLFGVGTITLHSSDKTSPTLEIQDIAKPVMVKELIHKNVEEMKIQRKMRVGEILEDTTDELEDIDEE